VADRFLRSLQSSGFRTQIDHDRISAPMIAIAPLEWPGMNQAFLTALIATLVLSLAIIPYGKRRPVGAPFSWGEAMLASTYIFGVLFLAFGILPHQWIDHADKDLGWSKDKIIYGPGGILKPESAGGWNPITLQYEAVRDIVAVLIHAALFGLYIYLAIWWQKRGEVKPKELPTSTYGRPLVKKA
jgi:predicted secreted protein